jgi:hypothetical protein
MKNSMVLLAALVVGGTGMAAYVGLKLRKTLGIERETQDRAEKASENIKADLEAKRQRDELRRNWENEHLLLSDETFAGFAHFTTTIGGINVSCPKCKEL